MTMIHDADINGGESAARCDRGVFHIGRCSCDDEPRAFRVVASTAALREMRAALKKRGIGSTAGLDQLIEEREGKKS